MNFDYLTKKTQEILELTTEERIMFIKKSKWIEYRQSRNIINKLEDLLEFPKTHRMPNLLIVGETNNGKTMLINRFAKKRLPKENPNGDGIIYPVFIIQAPPIPDESRFYNSILEKLITPYKSHERIDKKQFQVIKILKRINVKILIIDEIHHILAGNLNKQRAFLNTIKYLGNELKTPIVGVGTRDAFNAINTDPQLSNRFEPIQLPRWQNNDDFLILLASFEKITPLKKRSFLVDEDIASLILSISEGMIGEIATIISRAAIKAIKSGEERITPNILKNIDLKAPSKRKWGI